jgi:hypothetical protein
MLISTSPSEPSRRQRRSNHGAGHRSQRYIQRYTNSPEAVAASYIEEF